MLPRKDGREKQKQRLALVGFLLLAMVSSIQSRFVVEKNSLRVTSPESIKGTYDSAIGNFGIPQYGGSMAGTVVYPKDNRKGCKEFSDYDISFKKKPGALPTFVLLDRGDCFFALKVWNAQKAGAAAVLVADDVGEALITMDTPEEDSSSAKYIEDIAIPSALVDRSFGDTLKQALNKGDMVNVNLDWREAVPHPDARVEYELWTTSNDECGVKCEMLQGFVKEFKGAAQILEKGGYTQFTPHYITWYCPQAFTVSKQCKSQCINHGRYCAPDPEQDFSQGYDGKDVVIENLRQLCVFKVANETKKPWIWWDYCFSANEFVNVNFPAAGLDLKQVQKCMGDPDADAENPVLREEQEAQIGKGSRGDVTILPTLVVNNRQYREIETNECLENNGGCWQDKSANITACKDTFRGRVCECPFVNGVQFEGDGYSSCKASGPGKCKINNGGCWHETRNGWTFSACLDHEDNCKCPSGFRGDGVTSCEDIDECKEKKACQCPECYCKTAAQAKSVWAAVWVISIGLAMAAAGAYLVYKYRIRQYMDSEIRAIMAQYMPLDSQNEIPNHSSNDRA
ncbi:hypothetical protein Cgig2_017176 [Carnegiea gigantea]|uniref:Uncharacterized protein n=1 Tax=Carnegiea gigantea TaxID=171969 RepID=A0A9Q1K9X1_9CARY|nr:hypothetical protein Cgig2_017176 [Carnegiea gigantea]